MIHLNNEQLRAVRHTDGPMLVLAGPGSGKTAVLTERVGYLINSHHVNADSILVLTFSNKAADEMKRRFINSYGNHPVCFGTIHSIFFQILKKYNNYTRDNIITTERSMSIIRDVGIKLEAGDIDDKWCIDMLGCISSYKNTGTCDIKNSEIPFAPIFDEYCMRLRNAWLIDFDDMISDCLTLFNDKPEILGFVRDKYHYILVDEFQDCNLIQYKLLKLIAGDSANLYAVGDDDQSIYGFRGATSTIVLDFLNDYPKCDYVELIRNYRCAGEIIDCAYSLINHNRNRKIKSKQLPSVYRGMGEVCVIKTNDAYKEAEEVVRIIRETLKNGVKTSEIAVLYRSETSSDYLQELLYKLKIDSNRTIHSLKNREEVKDIVAYLKITQNKHTASDYLRILNKPERRLVRECVGDGRSRKAMLEYYKDDEKSRAALSGLFADIDFMKELPPYAAVNYLCKKVGYKSSTQDTIPHDLMELSRKNNTINSFLKSIENEPCEKTRVNKTGGIVLQTIHASKGLEYDTVIVIGLQEGIMPHIVLGSDEETEEERRLMYVAMTRAKKRLYLIARGKEEHGKKYSRFIYELGIDYKSMESYIPSSRNSSNASSTASYSSSSSM